MLIPLVYFIIAYFYQPILGSTLGPFLESDPVTFSIIIVAFLSLSKPIGGLIFGIAFWNTARAVSYEKKIKTCMLVSGWGIFFIFAANQGTVQQTTSFWNPNVNHTEYCGILGAGRDLQFSKTCVSE